MHGNQRVGFQKVLRGRNDEPESGLAFRRFKLYFCLSSASQNKDGLWNVRRLKVEEKRDFSLRRPLRSQERTQRKGSACSVRNDGGVFDCTKTGTIYRAPTLGKGIQWGAGAHRQEPASGRQARNDE